MNTLKGLSSKSGGNVQFQLGLVGHVAKQPSLFPLRPVVEFPNCFDANADAWGKVICDDGETYIAKGFKGGPGVPANEFISYCLARELGIPCPAFGTIERADGERLFGSQVIGDDADQLSLASFLTTPSIVNGKPSNPSLTRFLTQVYVFDLFINNVDRHDQNFISYRVGNIQNILLIDFARSFFWSDEFHDFPDGRFWTVTQGRRFRILHGFDIASANVMLDNIKAHGGTSLKTILKSVPDSWMTQEERMRFEKHLGGEKWISRVERLRKGINDGSLL